MVGIKERAFAPRPPVSLEHFIPSEHVYRHLGCTVDLGFVRRFGRDADATSAAPRSILWSSSCRP
jgi:hypothetical protein